LNAKCSYNGKLVYIFISLMTTWFYTLSLHDALPIYVKAEFHYVGWKIMPRTRLTLAGIRNSSHIKTTIDDDFEVKHLVQEWLKRSEEHTSELQSRDHLVWRLLLEKKMM